MKASRFFTALMLPVLLLLTLLGGSASAALQAVGPIDPVTTLPTYYQDPSNLALRPCLDQNGFCVLTPLFDPAVTVPPTAITATGPINDLNFPDESFYFLADSTVAITGGQTAVLRCAMEAAFLDAVAPDVAITFLRVNLKKMSGLTPNSTFTVTYPYGTFQFTSDGAGIALNGSGAAYRAEDPLGPSPGVYFPPELEAATKTHIGPFLRRAAGLIVDPISGHTYLGDPAAATTVTGSPIGTNIFRIDGPNIGGPGVNRVETNLFTVSGRVYTEQIPAPLAIERATYARDANSAQVDIFAKAGANAVLSISGTGLAATPLRRDLVNTGKFFATLPSATLLTGLSITNSLDLPPVPHPVFPVDELYIQQAFYNPVTNKITVKALSRDTVAPLPTLSVPAFPAPNSLDASGSVQLSLPANTVPPLTIQVLSSNGGSASAPVSVVTPPAAPAAANDSASTAFNSAVAIGVLFNDTSAAALDPASITIVSPSGNGSTVISPAGAVIFTPNPGFTGSTSFSYNVRDIFAQLSNTATVTVTVAVPPAPITAADSATTVQGTPVTITVLANDTGAINAASVVISTQTGDGTLAVNPTGTITFTPNAGFTGATSFAYTVDSSANPPLTSLPATVTVAVIPPAAAPAPVAVADSATTATGTPVTVNVLANDTIVLPGVINPASVTISTQSLSGSAVANANGTVTFSPAAGFTGSTTFAYTVANSSTPALTSNPALVTINVAAVAPAPVAVNNTATTTAGTPVTINVLANDTIAAPGVINTGSVAIATQSLNGTAVANPTGTITFSPAAGFTGSTSFSYTVNNSSTPALTSNAATVTVTVNAAAAQTIAVSRAQYTLSNGQYRIDGTVTPAPPAGTTLTIYNSALVGGPVLIGNLTVAGGGSFTWSSASAQPAPNTARRISIQSNGSAAKLENILVTVR